MPQCCAVDCNSRSETITVIWGDFDISEKSLKNLNNLHKFFVTDLVLYSIKAKETIFGVN